MFYCLKVSISAIFEKRVTDPRTDPRTDGQSLLQSRLFATKNEQNRLMVVIIYLTSPELCRVHFKLFFQSRLPSSSVQNFRSTSRENKSAKTGSPVCDYSQLTQFKIIVGDCIALRCRCGRSHASERSRRFDRAAIVEHVEGFPQFVDLLIVLRLIEVSGDRFSQFRPIHEASQRPRLSCWPVLLLKKTQQKQKNHFGNLDMVCYISY